MKILIVDDNPVSRLLPYMFLRGLGCVVTLCADGLTAIETVLAETYDFIFLDIEMPIVSGLDVCKEVRRIERGVRCRIFAYTAHASEEMEEKIRQAGFDGVLHKPITHEAVFFTLGLSPLAPEHERKAIC